MNDDRTIPDDRSLWRRWHSLPSRTAHLMCPDTVTLAAYLDDRLGVAERDDVEAHLAACPACLELVVELRAPPTPPVFVSKFVVQRATILVPPRLNDGPITAANLRRAVAWLGSAAALIIACYSGYSIGASTARTKVSVDYGLAEACRFGLNLPPRPGSKLLPGDVQ